MSDLVVVEKAGDRLPINALALDEHVRLGWSVSSDQSYAPEASVAAMVAGTGGGAEPPFSIATIPDNWRDLPWVPKAGETGIRAVASAVSDGATFKNKAEAVAAIEAHLAKQGAGENIENPDNEPVEIPEAWEAMTDDEMIALALAIVGGEGPLVPSEGQTAGEKAKAVISAEVEKRTGA